MIETMQGDLVRMASQGFFDVIAHGCNCFCDMKGGISRDITRAFPAAKNVDACTGKGDIEKLGHCTTAHCNTSAGHCDVVNAYTQYQAHGRNVLANYDAIRSCLRWIRENYHGQRIGLPKMCTGEAHGDWLQIKDIIDEELADEEVTIIELEAELEYDVAV
mgnify:CR=1 FL=1